MTRFQVLGPSVQQILDGDDAIIDPEQIQFDPRADYPVKLPSGVIVMGRLVLTEGRLMMEADIGDTYSVSAHFPMFGVRDVHVCTLASIDRIIARPIDHPERIS